MHSLKPVRPPVLIDEIPWHEMDIEEQLRLRCETEEGRRLKDIWLRGMAQIFVSASPRHARRIRSSVHAALYGKMRFQLLRLLRVLDKVIPYLKKVKNLRKIGVSPRADVRSSAAQIGGGYVLDRKPNPALVSGNFNADAVEKEITETVELCREYKCPYEFVMKDISTVNYKPQNLMEWAKTVSGVLDRYYT
jgi:hypothetical protein